MAEVNKNQRPTEGSGLSVPTAVVGMILTGFLGFFVGQITTGGGKPDAANPNAGTIYNIKVGTSPFRGKQDAKVTIIEFSDDQCPFCAKVEPTLDEARKKYGDDLRIVWKDNPLVQLHPNAMPAAIAARAVLKQGQDKFFAMHDILFKSQAEFQGKGQQWTPPQFEKFASQVPGIDIEKWKADVADPTLAAGIAQDQRDAATFGVTGTPAFF